MKKQIKWLLVFVIVLVVSVGCLASVNILIDPFGVFGDHLLNFYEYNMTNNPRVAKVKYLDMNHKNYDSYVIGGSKSSSINPNKLKEYFKDSSFYNDFVYGGTFRDYEMEVKYILDNYEVKNIILHESLHEVETEPFGDKNINNMYHVNLLGGNKFEFYKKFLFLDLKQSYNKLVSYAKYKAGIFDPSAVFITNQGVYNKVKRDVEKYDTTEEFLIKFPEFAQPMYSGEVKQTKFNLQALKNIKKMCDEKGVNFTFIVAPTYFREMNIYDTNKIINYYKQISEITDFWNFSGYTSMSYEPRNFYDRRHYRNSVGNMVVDRMFSTDKEVLKHIPSDFGQYITKENFNEQINIAFPKDMYVNREPHSNISKDVPVLIYHHISKGDKSALTPDKIKKDLKDIKNAGYETIFYKDLEDYVVNGKVLPEKPIIISFDDGYYSNYQYLYPLLKEYDMKAEIAVIGWSVGRKTYINSDKPIIPHFTWKQALEMINSNHVNIQSHTYDMHKYSPTGIVSRRGVLKNLCESYGEYEKVFKDDIQKNRNLILLNLGRKDVAFVYPNGLHDSLTEKILNDMGYNITVSIIEGINVVKQGDLSTLKALKRICGDYYNGNILDKISSYK